MKLIKIWLMGCLVLFAVTIACEIYFTVNEAFNSKKLIDAQIKVFEAQAENVGKPQVIEQRYYPPNK